MLDRIVSIAGSALVLAIVGGCLTLIGIAAYDKITCVDPRPYEYHCYGDPVACPCDPGCMNCDHSF